MTAQSAYRSAVALAVGAALFLVWAVLALGVIASEGDRVDLMYGGVLAVGIIGATVARLQPSGMSRTLLMMASAQGLVALIALLLGKHRDPVTSVPEILGVNAMFVVLFVTSAWLFQKAARQRGLSQAEG